MKEVRLRQKASSSEQGSLLAFFTLTFALSLPLWILGGLTSFELLPALPVSALMIVSPVTAAAVLAYRRDGRKGVAHLLKRAADVRRIRSWRWLVPTVLMKPALFAASYGILLWIGVSMPQVLPVSLSALGLLAVFFISALGEELGWMGFAIEPMQRRWGAVGAGVLLGAIWAAWHFVPFLQAGRSLEWIGWQSLYLIASRVILVWIFNNTGHSVFAAALLHATGNLSWQLFPVQGSHYDPRVTGPLFAATAVLITAIWGARRLRRLGLGAGNPTLESGSSDQQCRQRRPS